MYSKSRRRLICYAKKSADMNKLISHINLVLTDHLECELTLNHK